jgi:hypothetical protein
VLCCGAEIGLFICGIIALVKGTIPLSTNRVVQGVPARIIGSILLAPLIVGQGGELIMGFMWGIEKGMRGQQVNPFDAARELQSKAAILNAIAIGVPLLAVLVIALSTAKEPRSHRRFRRDWDDEDRDDYYDRPRRRRRHDDEDDDYDDDRPRSRRARDDDEDAFKEDHDRRQPPRRTDDGAFEDRERRRRSDRYDDDDR